MVEAAREFQGTERFSLRRKLGAGGMGVVYEAIDRLTNKPVALKTLNRAEPEHVYRLKREFRELADVSHPNLAALYELMSSGRHWFFTMELVQGVQFIEHVRRQGEGEQGRPSTLRGVASGRLMKQYRRVRRLMFCFNRRMRYLVSPPSCGTRSESAFCFSVDGNLRGCASPHEGETARDIKRPTC